MILYLLYLISIDTMFDFSIIKEVHFNIGPIKVDLGTEKERRAFAVLLAILGVIAIIVAVGPLSSYLSSFIKALLTTVGIILFVCGGLISNIKD